MMLVVKKWIMILKFKLYNRIPFFGNKNLKNNIDEKIITKILNIKFASNLNFEIRSFLRLYFVINQ
jgi:hypothetical protein